MQPRLYQDLAAWWPLLSPPEDYQEEAALYAELLRAGHGEDRLDALELGSGGGHCASQMRHRFAWTLTDLSPSMLEQSRRRNPEAEHVQGDMRTLRLGRAFDAVFVHDAVCYMTTAADLRAAMATAHEHCRPGGTALFVPDCVRETFTPGTDHGGADHGARSLRYFEWLHAPSDDDATVARCDMVLMLRENGTTRVVHDHHEFGVFARATWHELLHDVGFVVRERTLQPDGRPLFVCARP